MKGQGAVRDFELLKFDDDLALMLRMWIDDKLRALGDDISDYVKVNCIIHEACTMLVPEKEKKKTHKDWFDSAKQALLPLLTKRREAHKCWSRIKSKKDEGRFKKTKADVQRECRWAHNEFWAKVSDSLDAAAAECDTKKFFAVQRTGFGYEYMEAAITRNACQRNFFYLQNQAVTTHKSLAHLRG